MSALDQKQTHAVQNAMSALPSKADIAPIAIKDTVVARFRKILSQTDKTGWRRKS